MFTPIYPQTGSNIGIFGCVRGLSRPPAIPLSGGMLLGVSMPVSWVVQSCLLKQADARLLAWLRPPVLPSDW